MNGVTDYENASVCIYTLFVTHPIGTCGLASFCVFSSFGQAFSIEGSFVSPYSFIHLATLTSRKPVTGELNT